MKFIKGILFFFVLGLFLVPFIQSQPIFGKIDLLCVVKKENIICNTRCATCAEQKYDYYIRHKGQTEWLNENRGNGPSITFRGLKPEEEYEVVTFGKDASSNERISNSTVIELETFQPDIKVKVGLGDRKNNEFQITVKIQDKATEKIECGEHQVILEVNKGNLILKKKEQFKIYITQETDTKLSFFGSHKEIKKALAHLWYRSGMKGPTSAFLNGVKLSVVIQNRPVKIFAHSGWYQRFPPNTLLGLRSAEPFVDSLEVDIQPIKGHGFYIAHDLADDVHPPIDICNANEGELEAADVGRKWQFSGLNLPSLRQVLSEFQSKRIPIMFDLKENPACHQFDYSRQINDLVEAIGFEKERIYLNGYSKVAKELTASDPRYGPSILYFWNATPELLMEHFENDNYTMGYSFSYSQLLEDWESFQESEPCHGSNIMGFHGLGGLFHIFGPRPLPATERGWDFFMKLGIDSFNTIAPDVIISYMNRKNTYRSYRQYNMQIINLQHLQEKKPNIFKRILMNTILIIAFVLCLVFIKKNYEKKKKDLIRKLK
ncbi:glycerophosphodiester phosphodiesterase [Anaeramoeba flamelloides]|uniref:Glycerophosphodiester phosphodiesterase n=1 Tax=Anaeramoeba flamelloides TaxID=1746091 RepID=A0ABQ8YIG0_9EUKA|nr:glycerophosphodiester phosphodiesterase [Anaeramoeba flamelloides]